MLLGRWARAGRWLDALPDDAGRVLDAGCAFGFGTYELSLARGIRRIGGVEPDPVYVRDARRRCPAPPFVRSDAPAIPVRDGAMHTVVRSMAK